MPTQYRAAATPAPIPTPGAVPNTGTRPTPSAPAPVPAPTDGGTGIVGAVGDALTPDWLEGVPGSIGRAGAWMSNRDNWIRVAKVVAGGALIVVGLAQLAVKPAVAVAGAVTPVGKVATAVGKVGK